MNTLIKNIKEGHMSTVAMELLQANNTVTALEVKNELRKRCPEFSWMQADVSQFMNEMHLSGDVMYRDNGTYRLYVGEEPKKTFNKKDNKGKKLKKVKMESISKTKAFDLIMGTKGQFFTAEFVRKDGDVRVINCQIHKTQDPKLGYITVKDAVEMRKDKNAFRKINMQTLMSIKVGGKAYKVK